MRCGGSVWREELWTPQTNLRTCVAFEQTYAQDADGLLCECCQEVGRESCKHALGWHVCQRDGEALVTDLELLEEPPKKWMAGTLHGDKFDVESNLWYMARRLVPLHVLKDKLDVYIAAGHIATAEKDHYARVLGEMLGVHRANNLHGTTIGDDASAMATEPDETEL